MHKMQMLRFNFCPDLSIKIKNEKDVDNIEAKYQRWKATDVTFIYQAQCRQKCILHTINLILMNYKINYIINKFN